MRYRVSIHRGSVDFDETVEARDALDLFNRFRQGATDRLPFFRRMVVALWTDQDFMRWVVEKHNEYVSQPSPIPVTAEQFLDFAVKNSYVVVEGAADGG